jgi:hypothetical protein
MAHVYYPSYAEGGDGRSKSEASQGKKLTWPHFNQSARYGGICL